MSAFIVSQPALERNARILREVADAAGVPGRAGSEGVFHLALF